MRENSPLTTTDWSGRALRAEHHRPVADFLLRVVDAGLCGVIFVAPYFFGGRHDLGRLVLVSLIAATAVAWFARQAVLPAASWPRSGAYLILLLAVALVTFQIVPLPPTWLASLSPRLAELLPLWTPSGGDASLGTWTTISLVPHETAKSLAMLVSYSLLFIIVAGRIRTASDVERLLNWIAVAAVCMAGFGLVQFFTSDGRFFWFYPHPHRSTTWSLGGPFINRNHFASFLVLGIGPIAAALLRAISASQKRSATGAKKPSGVKAAVAERILIWTIAAALAIVIFTILSSRSRGGAIALVVAGFVLVAMYVYRSLVDGRVIYGLLGLVVAVVGLLSLHGYDNVVERLDDFTEGSLDDIDRDGIRRKIWTANVKAFESLWLTGAGAGSHREVLPIYLPQSFTVEYTHAENGYLQVATETGIFGVLLLAGGIGCCIVWCARCFRRANQVADVRLSGAIAAGLAASLVHSTVDFVWYIPACMSVTVILTGCGMRLSQLARGTQSHAPDTRVLPRGRWLEAAVASLVIGAWSVHTYVGPGIAAVYWDRYLRASVSNKNLVRQQMTELIANRPLADPEASRPLNELMVRQLEHVIKWDPQFARAHLRLAANYIARFELLQRNAENAMNLSQVRDAAVASSFASTAELHGWLGRAFGENVEWLRRAAAEARQAVTLSPLQGKGYVLLANLCFIEGGDSVPAESYVEQGLRVRPYDASVLFEVGNQQRLMGNVEAARERWQHCFNDPGPHQLKIVYLLAGRISAEEFLQTFQPNWRTLRQIWNRYRESGRPEDIQSLLAYTAAATRRETQADGSHAPAYIWYWQSEVYANVNRPDEALECLERAYASDPRQYFIRVALAKAYQSAGRFAEAEAHARWCLARRPDDKAMSQALVTISKRRLAERRTPIFSNGLGPGAVRISADARSSTK